MPRPKKEVTQNLSASFIEQLRRSPLRGLLDRPFKQTEIELELVDPDPTNPGTDQHSKRYNKRWQSIAESVDILGGVVYPLVVCEHPPERLDRYLLIDGQGRRDEAKRRGFERVRALVFPPLSLEERICLRQILNGAQEPFDKPLVLKDLQLLARERGLDIANEKDLRALLAYFPANVRKHEEKLRIMTKWPSEITEKISADADQEAGTLGIDKLTELDQLVNTLQKYHPEVARAYEGEGLYKRVFQLYGEGKFRDGGRSQEALRKVRSYLRKLPQNHPLVPKLLKGDVTLSDFEQQAQAAQAGLPKRDLHDVCAELGGLLMAVDPEKLTNDETRTLRRTAATIGQVLEEVSVTSR
jgi:hypothetical protein